MLITAGRTLALRFNHEGQYLRSFVAPESLFIDIMMNVPLIFYAARESGDRDLYDLAVAHCRTTERTLVRPDGSTAHEGIFDPDTGVFLRQSTHQGLRADSTWSRGLAWSLYGFGTVLYLHRRRRRFACRRAQRRLLPRPLSRKFDSALGFRRSRRARPHRRQLGRRHRRFGLVEPRRAHVPDRTRACAALPGRHADHPRLALHRPYMAWSDPGWEGVVKHGVYHFHKNWASMSR